LQSVTDHRKLYTIFVTALILSKKMGRQQAAGSRQQAAGSRQEAGGRRQEAGGRRQEAGGAANKTARTMRAALPRVDLGRFCLWFTEDG
jgi:hypothetical protein